MREETWIGPEEREVYVQFVDGKVVDVYTFTNNPLITEVYLPPLPQVEWVAGLNPLFLHADDPEQAIALMRKLDYTEEQND